MTLTFVERARSTTSSTEKLGTTARMIRTRSGCVIVQLTRNQNATPAIGGAPEEAEEEMPGVEVKEFRGVTGKIRGGANLQTHKESRSASQYFS